MSARARIVASPRSTPPAPPGSSASDAAGSCPRTRPRGRPCIRATSRSPPPGWRSGTWAGAAPWQRRCARRLGAADPRTGGVTVVQRSPHFTAAWKPESPAPDKYTWVKAPRFNGKPMQVGPLAQVMYALKTGDPLTVKYATQCLQVAGAVAKTTLTPAIL